MLLRARQGDWEVHTQGLRYESVVAGRRPLELCSSLRPQQACRAQPPPLGAGGPGPWRALGSPPPECDVGTPVRANQSSAETVCLSLPVAQEHDVPARHRPLRPLRRRAHQQLAARRHVPRLLDLGWVEEERRERGSWSSALEFCAVLRIGPSNWLVAEAAVLAGHGQANILQGGGVCMYSALLPLKSLSRVEGWWSTTRRGPLCGRSRCYVPPTSSPQLPFRLYHVLYHHTRDVPPPRLPAHLPTHLAALQASSTSSPSAWSCQRASRRWGGAGAPAGGPAGHAYLPYWPGEEGGAGVRVGVTLWARETTAFLGAGTAAVRCWHGPPSHPSSVPSAHTLHYLPTRHLAPR